MKFVNIDCMDISRTQNSANFKSAFYNGYAEIHVVSKDKTGRQILEKYIAR